MKNSRVKTKTIDTTKDRILYTGLALLVGVLAAAFFSTAARAENALVKKGRPLEEWTPHIQIQDEVKLPFDLKSQKLSH